MIKNTKYWAEFYHVGFFFAGRSSQAVEFPNCELIKKWPDSAYCYRFYKQDEIIEGNKVFKGEVEQVGLTYYHPESQVKNLEQVKKDPNNQILASNMKSNGWKYVIFSRFGNFPQPFDPNKDMIVYN